MVTPKEPLYNSSMDTKLLLDHYQEILDEHQNPQSYQYILVPPSLGISTTDVLHVISPQIKPPLHPSITRNIIRIHGPTPNNHQLFQQLRHFSIPADRSPKGEKVSLQSRWVADEGHLNSTLYILRISNINLSDAEATPIIQQICADTKVNPVSIRRETKEGVLLATFLVATEETSNELLSICSYFQYHTPRHDRNSWWLSPINFCAFCGVLLHRGVKHSCEGKEQFTSTTGRKPRSKASSHQLSRNQSRHSSPPRTHVSEQATSPDSLLSKVASQLQPFSFSSDSSQPPTPSLQLHSSTHSFAPVQTSSSSSSSSFSTRHDAVRSSTPSLDHKVTQSTTTSSLTKPRTPTPPTPPKGSSSKTKR